MPVHVVKQGEHLSRIAADHGIADYRTIWEHPDNAELKEKRKNPNVLFPGDRVSVPERELREEQGATEKRHRFQCFRRGLSLKIVLQEVDFKPIADTPCILEVAGESFELTTDGDGLVQQDILRWAGEGRLLVNDKKVDLELRVGHLDPVEERSGQLGRLNNLGYNAGTIEEEEEDDEQSFKSAVEEFQCDHGLKVDGICGAQTQAKLKEIHGC